MRALFGWVTVALGIVACGMFLGALYHGSPRVEAVMLGVLGLEVALAGGHTLARERNRAMRAAAARVRERERRRSRPRRARAVFLILLLAGAAAAGCLVYGVFR